MNWRKNSLSFEIGQKVMIVSKSVGRDYVAATHDIPYRFEMENNHSCPVGWITEIRKAYIVVAYKEKGMGIDYYLNEDLKQLQAKLLDDDLFEI